MMTQQDRGQLAMMIDRTARYYGKKIDDDVISMMIDDLQDLPLGTVLAAYNQYRLDKKNVFSPMPAQIREIIQPQVSDDTLAREAAARIPEAIRRYGYPDPVGARAFIGELGWSVVQRFGGWLYICEHHGDDLNPSTFLAQARDLAKSHAELSRTGHLGEAPALPQSKAVGQIEHAPKGLQPAGGAILDFARKPGGT